MITLRIVRDTSGECTLPADHSLIDDGDEEVSIHGPGKGNVWTITAQKKGRPVIKINNDRTGETVGEITVIVPNTPPKLDPAVDPTVSIDNLMPDHTDFGDYTYVTNELNPGLAFDDVDTSDDSDGTGLAQGEYRFKVHDKPDGVVIDTHRGFVAVPFNSDLTSAAVTMKVVILKNPNPGTGNTYDIKLDAYDRDNDVSDNPVTLTFPVQDPQSGSYDVVKEGDKFKKVRMGNRIGVPHQIDFGEDGFDFVKDTAVNLLLGGDRRRIPSHTIVNEPCGPLTGPSTTWKDDSSTTVGDGCFSVKPSNSDVTIEAITNISAGPIVTVQLDPDNRTLNETSDVNLTIAYHVVALSSAKAGTIDVDTTETGASRTVVSDWRKTLTLDIHKCVSTTDCP